MPEIQVQRQCGQISEFTVPESFGTPIGAMPEQRDANFYLEGNLAAGTWECEPGTLQLDLDLTEFCHLLEGHWVLTSESGQVTEIKAGDTVYFDNNSKGTWEVLETVRKAYLTYKRD